MSTVSQSPTIREARRAAGLTQQELAHCAECSVAYVRMLERGYEPSKPDASPGLRRVLRVLGLLNDDDPAPTPGRAESAGQAGPTDGT